MKYKGIFLHTVLFLALNLLLPLQVYSAKVFTVYTSNYPLTYFAERIGGNHINVIFPAPSDVDPAFWTPDAETIKKYQQADLIIFNGAGYEKWAQKVSLPMLRSIDTSRAFKDNLIDVESTVTHSHGPGGDHSHGGTAFTTWLDFSQAAQQAEAIYRALARKIPTQKTEFSKNFDELQRELLELDRQMTTLSAKKPGIPLTGSHPIYQYMSRRYNLNMKTVMWEPDTTPSKAEWRHLQELIKDHPASWMIWETKPLPATAENLQEMNIHEKVFSPCFSRPQQGDFISHMRENIENSRTIFDEAANHRPRP